MGQQIIYCAACGSKILDRDFESRAAFHLDNRGYCKQCAPEALKSLPPDKMAEVLAEISQAESSSHRKALPPPRRQSTVSIPAIPATPARPSDSSRTLLIAGAGVAAGVLIAIVAVMSSRSDPPPPPPPAPVDRTPKVDREATALKALRRAREYRDANPKDVATQKASFERLAEEFKGTRAAEDARRDLEEIRRRGQDSLDSELKVLQDVGRSASTTEEFQKAIQALTDARGRHPEPTWSQGIDRMISDIRGVPEKLYPSLKTAAVEARRRGAQADVKEAKERLAKWGVAQYTQDLEAALAAVPVAVAVAEKRSLIGKDLTGWTAGKGRWAVKDGVLETVELDERARTAIFLNEQLGDYELEGSIETTVRTYTEIFGRGDVALIRHLTPGLHPFRIVAVGTDVKFTLDNTAIDVPPGKALKGRFGIFANEKIRLRDLLIRP